MSGTVDFGIITALPIEREAVRRRLEGVVSRQYDGDPHTYYEGRLSIPESGEVYRVVLVMQLGMGNTEAATAATTLVARWHPGHVVMVGIAGGVRGKVSTGDVVVGECSYYYEPAKQTGSGEQWRGRQFPCSRVLYGRSKAYDAADWHEDLKEKRPALGATSAQPSAHFGPIAAGEKVVAENRFLERLQRECPQLLAVAMEGAGVALAVSDSATPWIEIRGISDYADETKGDDDWREYAADAAAAFLFGLLRTKPVPLASTPSSTAEGTGRPLLILCAQSLRTIGSEEVLEALAPEDKRRPREFISLDLTDLVAERVVRDPEEAARRLADPAGRLMAALERRADADFAFMGLCHIPFAMLAGHLASDRQPVGLYDYHPTVSNTWVWPDDASAPFPDISATGTEALTSSAREVILTVSTSYAVNGDAARAVTLGGTPVIDLTVASPERGLVRSAAQVSAYGRTFRRVVDLIATRSPRCQVIHVCYAGPMALAFHVGQLISENIHPPVVAWNYRQSEGYEWGIHLSAARRRLPSLVRPPSH